jgi:hypothetical protein
VFWIACGAVVAIEAIIWVLALPDVDIIGSAQAARESKVAIDKEYVHLRQLDARGKNGSPTGVFDAEKAEDIARLTGDYLITQPWKGVLEPHVKRYDEQLARIREFLVKRSEPLHRPVADSADKLGWYDTYRVATETLLKRMAEAGALVPPQRVQAFAGVSSGAMAPPPIDYGNDREVRQAAGIFTKGSEYPEPSEHPRLSLQFRMLERVYGALLEGRAVSAVNPIIGGQPGSPMVAAVATLRWGAAEGADPGADSEIALDEATRTQARAHRLTLDLRGPVAVLLAAQAALERSSDLALPVVVVTGSDLSRIEMVQPGDRKDVPAETSQLRLRLLVLDFTPAPAATTEPAP